MTNMSYCRFKNTLSALRDCDENWDSLDNKVEKEYSVPDEEELEARKDLLELCKEIAGRAE